MSRLISLITNHPREILFSLLGAAGLSILVLFFLGKVPLSYNLRNLTVRWRTTVMTALAFTLVVALFNVMLAFVNGMYGLTQSSGQPGNVIILAEGATDETFSTLRYSDTGDIETYEGILRENDRPWCSKETYLVINQPYQVPKPGQPKSRFVQLRGVQDPVIAGQVHGLELTVGNWFSDAGIQEAREPGQLPLIEAVVGGGLAQSLGADRTPDELAAAKNRNRLDLGDVFPLRGREWVVVGVLDSGGSTFDSEVWAKQGVIGPAFGKDAFTSFVVRAKDAATAPLVKEYFNTQYKKAALAAQLETDYFAGLTETSKQFLFAVVFVAIIMAVGGAFGVTNTMFAAISQRIKDIGVLRLLGYTRSQVLISFLLESLVIALIGGLIGCAISLVCNGQTVSSVVSSGAPGGSKFVVLKMTVDANVLSAGLLLTVGMGLIGGMVPAVSAVLLKPLEALR